MKTIKQELPKAQIDIIVQALSIREQDLQRYLQNLGVTEEDSTAIQYELFDILVLKKMLAYKVEISLTQPQVEYFTSINGVDYPMYGIEPIITDGVRDLSQIERDLLEIRLDLIGELYKKGDDTLAQIESYDNEFINIVISFGFDESKNIKLYRNTMRVVSK
jgi:hypothetical protein